MGGALLVGLYVQLPTGVGRDGLYIVIGSGMAVALLVGVRRYAPPHPLPWLVMAVGQLPLIVHAGHAFGLSVVAEGVEHANQMQILRVLGCESAQGFHLGRPVTASDVRAPADASRVGAAVPAAGLPLGDGR